VKSHLTSTFRSLFSKLPARVQTQAKKNYKLWVQNQNHPSLDFKRVHPEKQIYSVRVGIGWRALGVREGAVIVWFWIGSHSDYDSVISRR
jgi:hypothetical protein